MECRPNCGACCIAPSISGGIPGMPEGKAAGDRCLHLKEDFSCAIYEQRPRFCVDFQAEESVCGADRKEAMEILTMLETMTR